MEREIQGLRETESICVCLCVCMCVREREREKFRLTEKRIVKDREKDSGMIIGQANQKKRFKKI